MTNEEATVTQQTTDNSPLARIAAKNKMDPRALEAIMLNTVLRGVTATREEVAAFLYVCDRYGLDPIRKEVYPMKSHAGGLIPIVGVDGWATLVAADARCDGFTFSENRVEGELVSITCKMRVKGRSLDTEVTEYLSECRKNTAPWKDMPTRMLRHKALMQTARIVFGINGIYDEDEGRDIAAGSMTTDREQGADRVRNAIVAAEQAKAERTEAGRTDAPTAPVIVAEVVVKHETVRVRIEPCAIRTLTTRDKKKAPYLSVDTTDRETFMVYRTSLFDLFKEAAVKQGALMCVIERGAVMEAEKADEVPV